MLNSLHAVNIQKAIELCDKIKKGFLKPWRQVKRNDLNKKDTIQSMENVWGAKNDSRPRLNLPKSHREGKNRKCENDLYAKTEYLLSKCLFTTFSLSPFPPILCWKKKKKKSRYIRKAGETENPVCRTSRLTRLLFHSCPSKSRVLTCIVAQVALPLSHRFFGYATLHLQIRVILQPTIVNWLLPPALDTGWCLLQNQL